MVSKWWIAFAVFLGLVYVLSPILMPFLVAALLAYLGTGLVDSLSILKCSRTIKVSLVFTLILLGLVMSVVVIVPLIEQQVSALISKLPAILTWLKETIIPWLQSRLGGLVSIEVDKVQQGLQDNIGTAGGFAVDILGSLSATGVAFFAWLANIVLIPVLTFYFLRDWDGMMARLYDMVPHRYKQQTSRITADIDMVLSEFFKGQLLVMFVLVIIYSVGLSLVGLEFALIIGLVAGVVSFVPYLGLIVGLLLAGVATLFQFQDVALLFPVLMVFVVAQVLEGAVLTPLLVGDKIGLHAVAVIFAVMAGGQLFGFTGVLIALPVAAVLMVFLRYALEHYKESEAYLSEK